MSFLESRGVYAQSVSLFNFIYRSLSRVLPQPLQDDLDSSAGLMNTPGTWMRLKTVNYSDGVIFYEEFGMKTVL
jgi:hypothetical protein